MFVNACVWYVHIGLYWCLNLCMQDRRPEKDVVHSVLSLSTSFPETGPLTEPGAMGGK